MNTKGKTVLTVFKIYAFALTLFGILFSTGVLMEPKRLVTVGDFAAILALFCGTIVFIASDFILNELEATG